MSFHTERREKKRFIGLTITEIVALVSVFAAMGTTGIFVWRASADYTTLSNNVDDAVQYAEEVRQLHIEDVKEIKQQQDKNLRTLMDQQNRDHSEVASKLSELDRDIKQILRDMR